jgi:hypothetical protein
VETLFTVWMVTVLWWTWPHPPWLFFHLGTIALMLVTPFACFPFSKTLFLAFDLWIRPPTEQDFIVPHETARRHRPA